MIDPIDLSLFSNRMSAVCGEMGAVLRRAALSPNIKDRLDFSCAVFDADGGLCAQAAHIPVHLGSMAYAMRGVVTGMTWEPGDVIILNDPFLGGTHLPDVTVIAPLFVAEQHLGFVANRAHHADIGAQVPGSMPLATCLADEGIIIPPSYLVRRGVLDRDFFASIIEVTRNPEQAAGDFAAQVSANRVGLQRLEGLAGRMGVVGYRRFLAALNAYGERLAAGVLRAIPPGRYTFTDYMDDDGAGNLDIPICVTVDTEHDGVIVDFGGTAPQVAGNINCPLSVAAASVFYVFRCLMPRAVPACAGTFRSIDIRAALGTLVNAQRPAAVAAGNVETSTRVVDALLGALAQALPATIPAASHGSMNNIAMGSRRPGGAWDYYETLGGGMGAGPGGPGMSAIQTHMTNTFNTPVERLESEYPLRVRTYALRDGSAGPGRYCGGEGLIREYEFLRKTTVTLLTERRRRVPWGLQRGGEGARGVNRLDNQELPGKTSFDAPPGARLTIATAGGGGWGAADAAAQVD